MGKKDDAELRETVRKAVKDAAEIARRTANGTPAEQAWREVTGKPLPKPQG